MKKVVEMAKKSCGIDPWHADFEPEIFGYYHNSLTNWANGPFCNQIFSLSSLADSVNIKPSVQIKLGNSKKKKKTEQRKQEESFVGMV